MFGNKGAVLLLPLLMCFALMGTMTCSASSRTTASFPTPSGPADPLNARNLIKSLSVMGFTFSTDGTILVPSSMSGKASASRTPRFPVYTAGIVVAVLLTIAACCAPHTTTRSLPASSKAVNLPEGVSLKRQRKLSRAAKMIIKATSSVTESAEDTRAVAAWWWSWAPELVQSVRATVSWRPPALTTLISRTANRLVIKLLKLTYNRKTARDTAFASGQLLDAREKRRMRKRVAREQRKQRADTTETTTATATATTTLANTQTSAPTTPPISPPPSSTLTHAGPVAGLSEGAEEAEGSHAGMATASGLVGVPGLSTTPSDATPPTSDTVNTKETADIKIPAQALQEGTHGDECGGSEEVQVQEGGKQVVVVHDEDIVKDNKAINNNHHDNDKHNDNNTDNTNVVKGNNNIDMISSSSSSSNNDNNDITTTSNNNNGDSGAVSHTAGDAITIDANNKHAPPAPPAPSVATNNEIKVPSTPVVKEEKKAAPVTLRSVTRPASKSASEANKDADWADNNNFEFATLLQICLRQKEGCGVVTKGAKEALRGAGIPEFVIDGTPVITVTPQEASALLAAQAQEEGADGGAVVVEEVVQEAVEVVEEMMVVDVDMETAVVVDEEDEESATVVVVDDSISVGREMLVV